MILIIDTETNGLPLNYKAPCTDVDNFPRIAQLAWVLCDNDGNVIKKYCELIKPNGWTIPKEKFWIENNFSTEQSLKLGIDISNALAALKVALQNATTIIAHNLDFDLPILQAELIRLGWDHEIKQTQICTMKISTDLCQIPGRFGFKWPKLEELYRWLFNVEMEGAHDALFDVTATMKCYFEIKNRGLLPQPIVGNIVYTDIVRHDNLPPDQYFKLQGFSHSFLKREKAGVTPEFVMTKKVAIGSLVDKILTDPNSVTGAEEYYTESREIAIRIKDTFGDLIPKFKAQVSFTGIAWYNGLKMPTQGRLDWLLERHAVIDLKITEATSLPELVKFMGYDNQLWHYSKLAGVKRAYIIAYSTKLGKCLPVFPIDCNSNYNEFWAKGIMKFGSM